jgi:AraC family transcriptional regulator, regulatory protein of adaptative response / methylated-DNA-[protein]-cysteine methyltransferase
MVDATDLKSVDCKVVRVQVPLSPYKTTTMTNTSLQRSNYIDLQLEPISETAGLDTITYGIHSTPFGQVLIATTSKGICNLSFLPLDEIPLARELLIKQWSQVEIIYAPEVTQALIEQLFTPSLGDANYPLKLLVKGTSFQIEVWRALLKIPFATTVSYQYIAEMIGQPNASRAVGKAIGSNKIAYLIPCHRVIRANGGISGYRWGLECKKHLLSWEKTLSSRSR